MPALVGGGTVVLLEGRSFDAHEVWRVIEREIATRIVIVVIPSHGPCCVRSKSARRGTALRHVERAQHHLLWSDMEF